MIAMVIMAALCAATLSFTLHPLVSGDMRRTGFRLLWGMALAALGLYVLTGSLHIPSAPAAFETGTPRHAQRIAAQRELVLLTALSGAPDNVALLLELGTARIEGGHPQDALEVLDRAKSLSPGDPAIDEALGAAHYALALEYAAQPRKDARAMALKHFESAITLTPKTAEFRARLVTDRKAYSGGK